MTVEDRGRLASDPAGRSIRYAAAADRPAVEAALLEALRRGGPRTTPFQLAGAVDVMWDGTACAMTVDGAGAGLYTLTYQGVAGAPSAVMFAGVRDPHPWSDLETFLETVDVSTVSELPDWLVQGGQANDDLGTGRPVVTTLQLEAGTVGPGLRHRGVAGPDFHRG